MKQVQRHGSQDIQLLQTKVGDKIVLFGDLEAQKLRTKFEGLNNDKRREAKNFGH